MKIIFQNILLTKTTEAIQQEKEKDFHLFFSLPGKKSGYQPCTFLSQYAAFVIGAVAVGQVKQAQHTAHRPLPWIRRAIEHPADPAVENCSCTSVTYRSHPSSRQSPMRRQAASMASTSAWAKALCLVWRRLWPRPSTSPRQTTTAPTGISPNRSASLASSKAKLIYRSCMVSPLMPPSQSSGS